MTNLDTQIRLQDRLFALGDQAAAAAERKDTVAAARIANELAAALEETRIALSLKAAQPILNNLKENIHGS